MHYAGRGGDGGVEGDYGAVGEAGAFAEGGWRCRGGSTLADVSGLVERMQRESGWGHTGCRCESEEGGEGEDESSGEHCSLFLDWWKLRKLENCC